MCTKSPGEESVSLSLTFLGKKIRNSSIAPKLKQSAWETSALATDSEVSSKTFRSGHLQPLTSSLEELPGSVSEPREEVQGQSACAVHSTHLDKDPGTESGASASRTTKAKQVSGSDPEGAGEIEIFIPYESAKTYVMQIMEDVSLMKRRHLETVRGLQERLLTAAKDNQEKTAQKITAHYQCKLNELKKSLDLYRDCVQKKNVFWENQMKTLNNLNQKLLEEKTALEEKNLADTVRWEREKFRFLRFFIRQQTGILEMFSTRLDLLHKHQASTLQELQMARLELDKVQGMLKRFSAEQVVSGPPLLENTISPQAHDFYQEVAEVKLLVDHMAEENREALIQAKDALGKETTTVDQREGLAEERRGNLQSAQAAVRRIEIEQIAMDCIRKGLDGTWEIKHICTEPMSQLDEEDLQVLENMEKNHFAADRMKTVGQQLLQLQTELKRVKEDNKRIVENYNTERTMRKKYYNMVEDMKGKIRVFCRIRPMSKAELGRGSSRVTERLDDYSVAVDTPRGLKEFQYDKVFGTTSSQEDVFQDVRRLIQSTIDGFNVCVFAYGQTGSGKTFTMVGDKELKNPGIMPRAFRAIFDIIQENASKFHFKVSTYMLELYNERLLDLFVFPADAVGKKIEIKKDKKGLVFAHGAETKEAASAEELFALFQQGCANRHVAATKMNVESSRSHLIVGVIVESRNLTNGSVNYGKLSFVDLAGSERAAKTGAGHEQLKEANSINKSLSALGDVISALSTEQAHVPYRNNKLTQLMQDSLGGNAKTLMFVNVSPSSCNVEETLTALVYATRVKAITNTAQKISESKEVAQLREIIVKLKSGQPVEEDI